ncbi:MAG: hypothetical protein RLT05_12195 [Bauldia litoralis]
MTIKTKLLTLAAAAAITASIAGASAPANAAPIAPTTNAGFTLEINLGGIHGISYGYNSAYCRRLRFAARHGSFRARVLYRRHCVGRVASFRQCRRWYIQGYRLGNPVARRLYRRYCRFYR